LNKRQHKHHIDVQTDEDLVTVTIGSDGGVPGGFAKLFNRVVDSEVWARLSDGARVVYVPLVRFADHRNQFRVQIGRAAMMKYTGLSQSSIKRAIKDLIAHKLLVLIELGGVSANGENESNVYQLLVPTEGRRQAKAESGAGSAANPLAVQQRTPSPSPAEPPVGPVSNRPADHARTPAGDHADIARGSGHDPLLRNSHKEHSKTSAIPSGSRLPPDNPPTSSSPTDDAAVLLEEKGVEPPVARQLAQAYPYDRVVDVIAAMEYRRARGKCDNPGGFIRDALIKQWQTPKAVVDARARAEARTRAEAAERQARASSQREQADVGQEEQRVERLIASLDDDELALLAGAVLEKYRGNTAVTSVLTRKPARQCRLMKMEIAAMLSARV
jgi:hypothetical protein